MNKRLFFKTVTLLLVLVGSASAHEQLMHQHITREAFESNDVFTLRRLPTTCPFVGNSLNNYSDKLLLQELRYKKTDLSINYMLRYLLPDRTDSLSKKKSPLKISNICKQYIGGELLGICFGIWGAGISGSLIPDTGDDPGDGPSFEGLEYRMSAFYLGYVIGNALGVYIAGNNRYEDCSYLTALGGSFIGGLIGVSALIILDNKKIGACLSILGPPIGSIIGFNLSREPKESPGKAFINCDRGQFRLSLGNINLHYGNYKPLLDVNVFQANF